MILIGIFLAVGVLVLAMQASQAVHPYRPPASLNEHVNAAVAAAERSLMLRTGHKVQHVTFAGTSGGHPILVCDLGICLVSWCAHRAHICDAQGKPRSAVKIKDEHTFFLAKVDAGIIA